MWIIFWVFLKLEVVFKICLIILKIFVRCGDILFIRWLKVGFIRFFLIWEIFIFCFVSVFCFIRVILFLEGLDFFLNLFKFFLIFEVCFVGLFVLLFWGVVLVKFGIFVFKILFGLLGFLKLIWDLIWFLDKVSLVLCKRMMVFVIFVMFFIFGCVICKCG